MRGYMKATAALAAFALLVVVMGFGAQSSVLAQTVTVKVAPGHVCSGVVVPAVVEDPLTLVTEQADRKVIGGGDCEPGDAEFVITNTGSEKAEVEIKNTNLGTRPGGDTTNTDGKYDMSPDGNPKTIEIPASKTAIIRVVRSVTGLVNGTTDKGVGVYELGGYNGNVITVTHSPNTGSFGTTKSVTVDNIKPALLATRPANNLIVKGNTSIEFGAEISDSGSGFESTASKQAESNKIQLWVAGNLVSLAESNFTKVDGGWRVSKTLNSSAIASIGAAVPWYFSVKDKAGNPQTSSDSIQGVTSAASLNVKSVIDDTFKDNLNEIAFTGGSNCTVDDAVCVLTGARKIKVTTKVDGASKTSKAVDITGFVNGSGTFTVDAALLKDKDGKGVTLPLRAKYEILAASLIRVDSARPTFESATTGHAWVSNSVAKGTSAKATSIKVDFDDGNGSGLDPATVTPSAFAVSGNSVESVQVVDVGGPTLPAAQQTPDTVFLTLGSALGSSEQPTVSVGSGLIADKAGNAVSGGDLTKKAGDGLGPNLTLSRSGALSKTSVTITVASDEQLATPPVFEIGNVNKAGEPQKSDAAGSVASVTALSYRTTVSAASAGWGEFNVYATARDTGSMDNKGDVGDMDSSAKPGSFSFELDNKFNGGEDPTAEISDKDATTSAPGPNVEAIDPMIVTINYADEAGEYPRDSYSTVELISASLKVGSSDGTSSTRTINIANEVSSPDNKRFTVPVLNPQVGEYTLTVKAQDQAGNSVEHKLYWKVISAKPVAIKLVPGWNLISLPFQPGNPAINSVVPANHPADIVMTYDNVAQVWLVSRRDSETGLFTGDIAVMTANTAYFIRTDNYQELSVLRPPVATAAAPPPPPPAVTVVVGWNLVPVISLGVPTPTHIPADTYFGTLRSGSNAGWLKALTFDPLVRTWTSVTPGEMETNPEYVAAVVAVVADLKATPPVEAVAAAAAVGDPKRNVRVDVGKGYWLYATSDGVIIP